jgi:hypothetical protein
VKRARELIYTAERQASRDVSLAGLRPKPGSSHLVTYLKLILLLKHLKVNKYISKNIWII